MVEVKKWGKVPEADAQKTYLGAREKKIAVLSLLFPPSLPPLFFPSLLLSSCFSLLLLVPKIMYTWIMYMWSKSSITKQSAFKPFYFLLNPHITHPEEPLYSEWQWALIHGIGYKEVGLLDVGSLGLYFISVLEIALWQQGQSVAWLIISKGSPHMAGNVKICQVSEIEN